MLILKENNKLYNNFKIINQISKIKIIIPIIFLVIIFSVIIIYFFNKKTENYINMNQYEETNIIEEVQEEDELSTEKIIIYIIGEIKNPGVYTLDVDSRILDAIEMAGGTTENADLENINLAYTISDGEKIKIPSINEEKDGNNIDVENEIIENNSNSININTADISKLITLPGIGESTAQKIITYREENGKFKNIEDIKNVSGIGENKYNQIKNLIKTK